MCIPRRRRLEAFTTDAKIIRLISRRLYLNVRYCVKTAKRTVEVLLFSQVTTNRCFTKFGLNHPRQNGR